MRLKNIIVFALLSILAAQTNAQEIKTAAGARLSSGDYFALELKQHLKDKNYLNAQLGFIYDGAFLTGIYEVDYPISDVKGLVGKFGIGAHLGFWQSERYKSPAYRLGMDLILGIDYIIPESPFLIGLNWKPAADFVGKYETHMDDFGISFLFIFGKKSNHVEQPEE